MVDNIKPKPEINYTQSIDDVKIAYTMCGQGPVMVKAANWLSHIELDWHSPVWRHWLEDLSKHTSLVRYDERGCGLSDRDVTDLSFDSWVADLEAVVDAIGLKRFPLLGVSQGGAVAIAYALKHPERVSYLILYGAYGRGRLIRDETELAQQEATIMNQLIKLGWGREQHAFRQVFSSQFMPGGNLKQLQAFNELQRVSCSAENAIRFLDEFNQVDVMNMAAEIKCPTLVMHARGDLRVPFEEGRLLATQIPGAHFVPLDSSNHILLAEPAWDVFISTVSSFLSVPTTMLNQDHQLSDLSRRELEVLDQVARGFDNNIISGNLKLKEKTVSNHVTHIFNKLKVNTRAQAIVLGRESGLGKNLNI